MASETTPKAEGLKLARICKNFAKEKKAEDVLILDLRHLEAPTDFFVICTAKSEPQIKAISNSIELGIREEHGLNPYVTDGRPASQWVIMDYSGVMVHIMHPERRAYYDLEGLWGDAKKTR